MLPIILRAYQSVRSCACATSSGLDSVKIVEQSRHKVMMKEFATVLVIDDEREDWQPACFVTAEDVQTWVFLPDSEGFPA